MEDGNSVLQTVYDYIFINKGHLHVFRPESKMATTERNQQPIGA
jgi:hypothetical protein